MIPRPSIAAFVVGLMVLCFVADVYGQRDDRIEFAGQDLWINGGNVAWIDFARDIGPGSTRLDLFEEMFREMRDHGGNSFRLWLHTNGASTPEFQGIGADAIVVGPGPGAIDDLRAILDLAYAYDIGLMLCLWSFDMLHTDQYGAAVTSRNRPLLTDETRLQSYIDNALVPMVNALRGHPAILAWEIFNEPEGMSTQFGWTRAAHRVPMSDIQRFVNRTAGAIKRSDPNAYVTNGSWSFRASADAVSAKAGDAVARTSTDFSADELDSIREGLSRHYRMAFSLEETRMHIDAVATQSNFNYYSDDRLVAAGNDPDGTLDFYTVHYYEHFPTSLSPFHHDKATWGLGKPVIVAEFFLYDNRDGNVDATFGVHWRDLYTTLFDRGYAGAMGWQWFDWWTNRQPEFQNWPRILENIHRMSAEHPEAVTLVYPGLRVDFSADPEAIELGGASTLRWSTRGATRVTLDGADVSHTDTLVVHPVATTVFELVAIDDDGTEQRREVTVSVVDPSELNRALGRPAVASSSEGLGEGNDDPNHVTDGNSSTRWSSAWRDGEWVYVDLGEVFALTRVVLEWEEAFAADYDIDVSYDARSWMTVHAERDGMGGTDDIAIESGPEARYVRMNGLKRSASNEWGFSLYEFQVYGLSVEEQPPLVSITAPEAGVFDRGDMTISASVQPASNVDYVLFLADGDSIGAAVAAPYHVIWQQPEPSTYRLTAIAYETSGRAGVSAPIEVEVIPERERVRYQVQQATYTGDVTIVHHGQASHGMLLEMRDSGTITWPNVEIAQGGSFELVIGFRLPFDSPKTQHLRINGADVTDVEFSGEGQAFLAKSLDVDLVAGTNTIQFVKYWGWMQFDYIEIVGNGQSVSSEVGLDHPAGFALGANYPNPFNPTTVIPFEAPRSAHVRIEIVDVMGRQVGIALDGVVSAGRHRAVFDASTLPSGVYFYRMSAEGAVKVGRMVLVK